MVGPATGKARPPTVNSFTDCTSRWLVRAEWRERRPGRSATRTSWHRYDGAVPWVALYMSRAILNHTHTHIWTRSSVTAQRAVSQNLINQVVQQIEVMELDGYGWPIVVKQPPLINCHIGVVDKLGRPRQWRHVLLIMRLTCPGEIEISKSWVWGKVSEGSTLTFWDTQVSFITQCEIGGRKPTCQEQLDSSSPFDTIPACDEQTDGQDTRPR